MNYKCNPLSRKNIRDMVSEIKKHLGCENFLMFDVIKFLELILPQVFDNFEYEIVEDSQLNCYAKAYPQLNKIILSESVYNGAVRGNHRDRFTIAHEIGHFFLHDDANISFARGENIKPYENPEWQANTFAAELLVPHNLIKSMSIEEISHKCNVSRQVAEIQKSHSF
ncbi:ImmA/IrrE family metallo-endopeptidase [Peptoanaerobacter stomatis]|uniref:ImmA/IrrE family metallo-endopeptidase n=1 Tax=Peptoanaerobacter stomatis TaxID=796937 RepID=UPI003FA0DACB